MMEKISQMKILFISILKEEWLPWLTMEKTLTDHSFTLPLRNFLNLTKNT